MNTGLGENIWLPAGVKLWVASRQNARQTLRCLRCLFVACVRNAGGARAAGLMPPPPGRHVDLLRKERGATPPLLFGTTLTVWGSSWRARKR